MRDPREKRLAALLYGLLAILFLGSFAVIAAADAGMAASRQTVGAASATSAAQSMAN
jgi:hypothetical protein